MAQYPIILIYMLVFALFLKSTYAQSDTLTLCAGGNLLATINKYAIITQSCLSKDYISDGSIWKPCDSYDVSFELDGSNFLCIGTSTIKDRPTLSPKIRQWVECCPDGRCQSSTHGIRLLPGRNVTLALNDGQCPLGEVERGVDDLGNVICDILCNEDEDVNPITGQCDKLFDLWQARGNLGQCGWQISPTPTYCRLCAFGGEGISPSCFEPGCWVDHSFEGTCLENYNCPITQDTIGSCPEISPTLTI